VLYEGEKLVRAVSSLPKAKAWSVRREDGKIVATALETEVLAQ